MKPGDVVSYLEMCSEENVNLQRGMNFRLGRGYSVVLMSIRPGAPYEDRIEEYGRVLIYEGHDINDVKTGPNPKQVDQPMHNPGGTLTQNGEFFKAAIKYKERTIEPELVKVYEKIRSGIWVYNGLFQLIDAWREQSNKRKVFKFMLRIIDEEVVAQEDHVDDLEHNRLIPSSVKLEVWKRDKGQCVKCGQKDNLHFDHIIPFAEGGSSLVAENIQILCARHNLQKRDKIQ